MRRSKKYKLNEAMAIVERILEFKEKHQNRKGQGLKLLTPQQMLSRLPYYLSRLSRFL